MRRILIIALKSLVIAELIYIGLSFAFLNSGLLPWLINSKRTDDLKIAYDFAYSLYPGSVRASHLTIRVNDEDVQLYFHLHNLAVRVHLAQLFEREFVASGIDVRGLDFRLRFRRTQKELKSPIVPFLPPIPGLLPVRTPPSTEAPNPHPWKVRLADVQVRELEEIWIEEYRYQGNVAVTGDLFLSPGHNTEVHQAKIVTDIGRVTLGDSEVASGIHAHIQASLGPYEKTKFLKTNEILNYLSATVDGSAHITGFEFLNHYLRKVEPIHLEGGVGPIATHLVLEKGHLTGPSNLKIQADDLRTTFWDQRAHGNAYIDWHIERLKNGTGLGRLSLLFPRFVVQHREATQGRVEGRDLSLLAITPDLDLKDPFQRLDVEVRTPEARITDLSYFATYFPKESRVRLHGGEGTLDAAVFASSRPNHKDTGYLHLNTHGVHLDLKAAELQGDITVDGVLHQGNLNTGVMDISGTQVYLRNVAALTRYHEQAKDYRNWWGTISLPEAVLHLKNSKSFQADVRVSGRDGRPILGISTSGAVPGVLNGILGFENLEARLRLLVSDELLSLSDAQAQGGGVTVKGWLRTKGDDRLGKVLVEWGPTAAGLAIHGSDLELKLNNAYDWYAAPATAR